MGRKQVNVECFLCNKPAPVFVKNHERGNCSKKFIQSLSKFLKNYSKYEEQEVSNNVVTCNQCFELGESFCYSYFQWEYLRIQLEWRVRKIYEVIQDDSPSSPGEEQEEEEVVERGNSFASRSESKNLREHLANGCKYKLNSSIPQLVLQKFVNTEVAVKLNTSDIQVPREALLEVIIGDQQPQEETDYLDVVDQSPSRAASNDETQHKTGQPLRKDALRGMSISSNLDSNFDHNSLFNPPHSADTNCIDSQLQDNNLQILSHNGIEIFDNENMTIMMKAEPSYQNTAHHPNTTQHVYNIPPPPPAVTADKFKSSTKPTLREMHLKTIAAADKLKRLSRKHVTKTHVKPSTAGTASNTANAIINTLMNNTTNFKKTRSNPWTPCSALPQICCPFCMATLSKKSNLKRHMRACVNKISYDTTRRMELDSSTHPSINNDDRSTFCITRRSFKDPYTKEKTIISHESKFPCPFCLKVSSERYILKNHIKKRCKNKIEYDTILMQNVFN